MLLFRIVLFLLLVVTILDPGNVIFKLKEVFFVLSFVIGFNEMKKYSNNTILFGSSFFSFIFPVVWLILGFLFDYNFSPEYGTMYLKAFVFFILINVCLNPKIDFARLFAISTLLIVPVTIILYYFVGGFEAADVLFLSFKETFVVSKRAFGSYIFDPVIFYKTSPLLIFGIAYLYQERRFKSRLLNLLFKAACVFTIVISATRANMICTFLLICIFFYRNNIASSQTRKLLFWTISSVLFVVFLIPFLSVYVFDTSEESNSTKLGLLNDYSEFWSDNSMSVLFGQGLGGGFKTVERGMSYLAEPTYFEILRMFGIIGLIFFLIYLFIPLYLFLKGRTSSLYNKYYYMFIAYILYIFVEIPSNPLLLASTGMLVMVMVYSASIKIYFSRNHNNKILCT